MKNLSIMTSSNLNRVAGASLSAILLFSPIMAGAAGGITVDGQIDDWAALFNPDGSVKTGEGGQPEFIALYGGQDANFVWDEISAGTDLDFTALDPGSGRPVKNGLVRAEDDVARAYFYVEPNDTGQIVYYVGLERVAAAGDSYIDIEFNQDLNRLGQGSPWEIVGERSAGDAMARLSFAGGALAAVSVQRALSDSGYRGTTWDLVVIATTPGCDGYVVCVASNTDPIVGGGPWSGYEETTPGELGAGEDLAANTFIELSINVGRLIGSNVEFASARVSTPEDIAFGYFGEGDWGGN